MEFYEFLESVLCVGDVVSTTQGEFMIEEIVTEGNCSDQHWEWIILEHCGETGIIVEIPCHHLVMPTEVVFLFIPHGEVFGLQSEGRL